MVDDPRDKIDVMLSQIRDPARWPAPPPALRLATEAEIAAALRLAPDVLARRLMNVGRATVAVDPPPDDDD